MKKVSVLSIIASVLMLLFAPNMFGQSSTIFGKETFLNSVANTSDADKLAMESIKLLNERMYSDFRKNYKNASDIRVDKVGKNNLITCDVDGKKNRIMYSKNGRWQHTLRTYDSEKLATDIRESINDFYPRYSIFGSVVEVSVGNATAFLVTIEDKTSWKRVRVVNGEIDVYEEHLKL